MSTSSISVVIPNYNHARFITGQLDVLTSQSLPPLEIVVIDDASTDDSVAVIEEYARRHPLIRLVRNERNRGVVATLNRGLEEVRGEFFYGGAADDLVAPGLCERIQGLIDRFPEAGIYFGKYRAIDADDREIRVEKASRWHEETFASPERFLNEYLEAEHVSYSLSSSTVYRTRYIQEIGGFRKELGHWCDTFLIRAIGLKYGAAYTPQVLAQMRRLHDSFSQTQARDYRKMLDVIGRAAWLMRSPEFRDRFPEAHVARWEQGYRDFVIWGHLWASHPPLMTAQTPKDTGATPSWRRAMDWTQRLRARLLLSYYYRRLRTYVPDLSCYDSPSRSSNPVQTAPSAGFSHRPERSC